MKQADADRLIALLAECAADPFKFVRVFFPWGEAGELERFDGPDAWQAEVLKAIRDQILTAAEALRLAISAGNGPGKSALVAWLILWALATKADTRGVVTANTDTQLRTKTWAELAKWFNLFLGRHLFTMTATAIYSKDEERERTWRIDGVPWSERNVEAFAGLHNKGRRLLVIFDEASAIPDVIWETTEGALTDKDTQIVWLVAGNPTRNSGRFRECFGRLAHRWQRWQVDTRRSKFTNQEQIAQWIADYGDDSDYVRVHVKGEFPRAGSMQFISMAAAEEAASREAIAHHLEPLVLGVDVARFGDDQSVLFFRKGRDGRTHPPVKYRGLDLMQLASRVAEFYTTLRPQMVFVDEGGMGAGVVDRLRQLGVPVLGVNFGARPDRAMPGADAVAYGNKAAEMWGHARDWLKAGAIPDDPELKAELTSREYFYVQRDGREAIMLESKSDMKKRGLASPDVADALALTFAYPVVASLDEFGRIAPRRARILDTEYDPMADRRGDYNPFDDLTPRRPTRIGPIEYD